MSENARSEEVSVSPEDQGTGLVRPEPPTPVWDAGAAQRIYDDSVAAIYIGTTNSYVIAASPATTAASSAT